MFLRYDTRFKMRVQLETYWKQGGFSLPKLSCNWRPGRRYKEDRESGPGGKEPRVIGSSAFLTTALAGLVTRGIAGCFAETIADPGFWSCLFVCERACSIISNSCFIFSARTGAKRSVYKNQKRTKPQLASLRNPPKLKLLKTFQISGIRISDFGYFLNSSCLTGVRLDAFQAPPRLQATCRSREKFQSRIRENSSVYTIWISCSPAIYLKCILEDGSSGRVSVAPTYPNCMTIKNYYCIII